MNFVGAAIAVTVLLTLPVRAAEFTVQPIKDASGAVSGCLAQDAKGEVGFLAVASTVVLFAHSDAFSIAKGTAVTGTYAVDSAAPVPFASNSDTANTATIDVPNDAESVAALVTGNRLTVTANGKTARFDIANTAQAFSGLVQCMTDADK